MYNHKNQMYNLSSLYTKYDLFRAIEGNYFKLFYQYFDILARKNSNEDATISNIPDSLTL